MEFNWVGCDSYGRDLLDLDEADSELLNIETCLDEVERDIFLDININKESNESKQLGLGLVKETHFPVQGNMPKEALSEGSTSESGRCPPTLLELEVQALAKIGVVKLYHDSRDLEKEEARVEEEKKLAIIDQFDRKRQTLSPFPRQQEQFQAPDIGDLLELEKGALSSNKHLVHPMSTYQTSGGMDLLELQKMALSSMNIIHKSYSKASTSAPLLPPIGGDSDLLELQKAALSRVKGEVTQTRSLINGTPSNVDGDRLQLQKVAHARVTKLSKVLQPQSPSLISEVVLQSTTGGDLLELERRALANMQNHQNEPSSSPTPTPLQTTSSTKSPQQAARCSSSKQEKEKKDLNPTKAGPPPLQTCTCLLPLQKASTTKVASPTQQTQGVDLSKLQKLAIRNMQQATSGVDLSEQQNSHRIDSSGTTPIQGNQKDGRDVLELQKVPSNPMIFGKGRGKWFCEDIEPKQQNNTQGVGGTSSSPIVPSRETLDTLLQELSSKDQALQSTNRIIEERNELLQEYKDSLANALSLLESMNVQCTDSKEEIGKILTTAKEIFQNLSQVCSAFENYDCSVPQCGKGIHCLEGPSPIVADNNSFLSSIEAGLGVSQGEMNERKFLIEELLKELSTIEITRKEAQCGFQLQIQRNEQLIAKLQKLDVAPMVSNEVPSICDGEHVEVKSQEIARHHKDEMVSKEYFQQAFEHPRDNLKGNLNDHTNLFSSDLTFNNSCDHTYVDPSNPTKGNLCDHVYEVSNDQSKGIPCDHVYEGFKDQSKGIICNHVYEGFNDQSKGILCDHVYEGSNDQSKKLPCDHAFEGVSDQAKQKVSKDLSDVAKQNYPSNLTFENSGLQAYESPHEDVKKDPFDKANGKLCNHVYVNPKELASENTHDQSYEIFHDQCGENKCGYAYGCLLNKANKNPCEHSHKKTSENPSDHEFVSSCDQISKYTSDQTLQDLNDFAYEDGKDCGPIPKYATGQTIEDLNDFAYEDGKDCGTIPKQENIESDTFNLSTWMPPIYDKQIPISSNGELLVSTNLRPLEISHQRKELNYIVTMSSPNALWVHLQHFVNMHPNELLSPNEHKAIEIYELHNQIDHLKTSLLQEQENSRNILLQKLDKAHHGPTKMELEEKDKLIRKMQFQIHQLDATLRQEREEYREALAQKGKEFCCSPIVGDPNLRSKEINELRQQLYELQKEVQEKRTIKKDQTHSIKVDIDHLQAKLHAKDEDIRQLQEIIARKEVDWQAEKHQMMKHFDDLETKLLVKEEENINLTHELEISRSSLYSPNFFNSKHGSDGSHFFHSQLKDEGREILDLRCEVLSLQDCLGIKTQAIKTMEKELERSYNIVTELRGKLRGLQECERNSLRQGQDMKLIERLKRIEDKLHKCQNEKAMMSGKIHEVSKRCQYLEQFEHLQKEGSHEVKVHESEELEKALERNGHIIQNLQARCNEYEGRARQVEEELERKDQLLMKLQDDMKNLTNKKCFTSSPIEHQPNEEGLRSTIIFDKDKLNNSNTNNMSISSHLEHVKVESPDVNTLRELLRDHWRVQKVMEDRLNTMMAYVSDRVDEFDQISPSDATSDSSFIPNPELNHFHVEAKLMKLQLEQQLQILRGTTFTSLPSSGVTSPGKYSQNSISRQNLQLMNEKFALEDSAQTLQEKTSRLLNKLTFMRSEFGPNSS